MHSWRSAILIFSTANRTATTGSTAASLRGQIHGHSLPKEQHSQPNL